MSVKFKTPGEACVAIALVVIGADEDFDKAEFGVLLDSLSELDTFENYTRHQLRMTVSRVHAYLREALHRTHRRSLLLSVSETRQVVVASRSVLDMSHRKAVFELAVRLAAVEPLIIERLLLTQIQYGLDISDEAAQPIYALNLVRV